MSFLKEIPERIKAFWEFVTIDIWTITDAEVKGIKHRGISFLKIVSLAIRRYDNDHLQSKASALTYSTLLSIIPILAVLFSIANGFGFHNILKNQLFDYFPGQKQILEKSFTFVDSYMQQTQGGLFLGIGIVLLLYTIMNLLSTIENCFNSIWKVKKGRTYYRRITDYFSVLLLFPVFIVCSSGLSIFVSTLFETLTKYELITPVFQTILKIAPFVVTIFMFTGAYMFLPNTKVRFKSAFYAGIFAGITFQLFQYLYISGQIWVSRYNAIYGSFAALPLLLLWLQLSWLICLLGAEIAYANQNIHAYDFEADSRNISRRYKDFLRLLIATLIVKRFDKGEKPYSAETISVAYKIPTRLTSSILFELLELGVINEVVDDENNNILYQPALDINKITVGYLFSKVDLHGSENFKVDKNIEFREEWEVVLKSRTDMVKDNNILLKDI